MHRPINNPGIASLPPRYRIPEIREHLAGQYVLGCLHPLTRQRLEHLLLIDPSWWQLIEAWQYRLQTIVPETSLEHPLNQLPSPPERVWQTLQSVCQPRQQNPEAKPLVPWWRRLFLPTALASAFSVGVISTMVLTHTTTMPAPNTRAYIQPANYLAMMSAPDKRDHFTLVAYKGDKPGTSSIRMQRNLGMNQVDIGRSMVWVRNKKTDKLSLLSSLQQVDDIRYLTPTEWQSLIASSELVVTENSNPDSPVLYRGRCIELKGWSNSTPSATI